MAEAAMGVIDVSMGGQLRCTCGETEARKGPSCPGSHRDSGRARINVQIQSGFCGCKQQKWALFALLSKRLYHQTEGEFRMEGAQEKQTGPSEDATGASWRARETQ